MNYTYKVIHLHIQGHHSPGKALTLAYISLILCGTHPHVVVTNVDILTV